MKKYIGTKIVKAKQMTRLEYNILRGWSLPADENGEDRGYLVEYVNDGRPNHAKIEGCITWSPANVFEEYYIDAPVTHLDRMDMEKNELVVKIGKITDFINAGKDSVFDKLSTPEQELLIYQQSAMNTYLEALTNRIMLAMR